MRSSHYITKEELALHLRVSVATINKWIQDKKLTPIKFGRKCLFNRTMIDEAASLPKYSRKNVSIKITNS